MFCISRKVCRNNWNSIMDLHSLDWLDLLFKVPQRTRKTSSVTFGFRSCKLNKLNKDLYLKYFAKYNVYKFPNLFFFWWYFVDLFLPWLKNILSGTRLILLSEWLLNEHAIVFSTAPAHNDYWFCILLLWKWQTNNKFGSRLGVKYKRLICN